MHGLISERHAEAIAYAETNHLKEWKWVPTPASLSGVTKLVEVSKRHNSTEIQGAYHGEK